MYKKLKYSLLTILAMSLVFTSLVPTSTVSAACPPDDPECVPYVPPPSPAPDAGPCGEYVFTFPTWFRGVVEHNVGSGSCDIKIYSITDFIKIPLNVLEILIQAVAYAAAGYVLWGGFKYMKSQGDPGKISEAKTAIINALTGLGIALASVAIVEFIQGAVL